MWKFMTSLFHHKHVFTLLLFFLPSQLNFFFWPEWSIVLGRRIDILAPSVYFTDLLLFLLIALWIIEERLWNKFFKKHNSFLVLLTVFFILSNTYISQHPIQTFLGWLGFIKYVLLFVYLLETSVTLQFITKRFAAGVCIAALLGIAQVLAGHSIGGVFYWFGERTFFTDTPGVAKAIVCMPQFLGSTCSTILRAYATLPHPNVFAAYVLACLLLLFHSSLFKARKKHLLLYTGCCIFFFVSLLTTFSRSALAGLGLGIVSGLNVLNKKIRLVLILFVFCIGFFASLPIMEFFTENRESFQLRQVLFSASLSIFKEHPVHGIGLKQFIHQLPEYTTNRTVSFLQPVHSVYALLLVETGIVGVLCVIFLAVYTMKHYRLYIPSEYIALIIPFLFLGVMDHYLMTLHQGLLLFTLILGISVKRS